MRGISWTGAVALRRVTLITMAAAAGGLTAACFPGASPAASPSAAPATAAAKQPASAPPASAAAAPPAGKATSSCDVITLAEASAALGQQVKAPIMGKAYVEGGVACVFYGPDVPPGASPDIPYGDTVRVVLVRGPKAKFYFDDYRGKVAAKPLSGLGDAAYYDGYASVSVLKGDAYVRINVGIFHNLGPEKVLAADALPRM